MPGLFRERSGPRDPRRIGQPVGRFHPGIAHPGSSHFPGNPARAGDEHPGPAALGVLRVSGWGVHYVGFRPDPGRPPAFQSDPPSRTAPYLLWLPEPRQTLESLCPKGGGGPGGGDHPHSAAGRPAAAAAPRESQVPAPMPKLRQGDPPDADVQGGEVPQPVPLPLRWGTEAGGLKPVQNVKGTVACCSSPFLF